MPTLKQITCTLEWSASNLPMQEYQTSYADGFVETYVAIPSVPTPFSVHLKSHGYIAPGLAMFVYMDGIYQCNRNRRNLKIPDGTSSSKHTEVDFHVRQKEEMTSDGTFIGKQWRFEKLRPVTDSTKLPNPHDSHDVDYAGTIEVLVLRCLPTETPNFGLSRESAVDSPSLVQAPSLEDPDIANFQISPDNDSSSSGSSNSVMGGIFDGAYDPTSEPGGGVSLGGDMAWDDPSTDYGPTHRSRPTSISSHHVAGESLVKRIESAAERVGSQNWSGRNPSRERYGHDWGSSSPPPKSRHSINSTQQQQPQAHPRRYKNGSKEQVSPPYAPKYSPVGSRANRSNSFASQRITKNPAAPASPGVVININQGPRSGLRSGPPPPPQNVPTTWDIDSDAGSWASRKTPYDAEVAGNIVLGNENAKVNTWEKPGQDSKSSQYHLGEQKPSSMLAVSVPENRKNTPPRMPGDWPSSSDQSQGNDNNWNNDQSHNHTRWRDRNDSTQRNNSAWGANENKGASNWGASDSHGQGDYYNWNADDNTAAPGRVSTSNAHKDQDQGWGSKSNNNVQRNEWERNDHSNVGSNYHTCYSQANDQDQAQCWGGKTEDRSTQMQPAQHTQGTLATHPGAETSQDMSKKPAPWENPSSPFRFPSAPNDTSQTGVPPPSHNQSGESGIVWDSSGPVQPATTHGPGSLPDMASQKPTQPVSTHEGQHSRVSKKSNPVSSVSLGIARHPRPYWSSWKHQKQPEGSTFGSGPAEPLYKIPLEVARRQNMSHQVCLGQPAVYVHRKSTPNYMDSHENPYAVFVFKYRSRATLERILHTKLREPEIEEKQKLQGFSKEELIEQILQAKAKRNPQGSTGSGTSGSTTESGGSNSTAKAHTEHKPISPTGGTINEKLSHLHIHGKNTSDNTSTNPEHHWGRDTQAPSAPANPATTSWNDAAPGWHNATKAPSHPGNVVEWLGGGNAVGAEDTGVTNGGIQHNNNAHGGANWTGHGGSGADASANQNHGSQNTGHQQGGTTWNGKANWTGEQAGGGWHHHPPANAGGSQDAGSLGKHGGSTTAPAEDVW